MKAIYPSEGAGTDIDITQGLCSSSVWSSVTCSALLLKALVRQLGVVLL